MTKKYKKLNKKDVIPWIEKYRPTKLNDIVSQTNIIKLLKIYIKNRTLPHLLFYGPPGTGKTSVIISYAKQLYKKNYPYMVMELNASDERGIEVVRNRIKQFVMSDNVFYELDTKSNKKVKKKIFKLVILDETDAMTDDAQAILRHIVERYTENARFCLICNYIKKINPALQSRCSAFRFSPINDSDMNKKLIKVIKKENIPFSKSGINSIILNSNGDLRKALNILQSISMSYKNITSDNVNACIGTINDSNMKNILNYILHENINNSYNYIMNIMIEKNISLFDIINKLHKIFFNMIVNDIKYHGIMIKKDKITKILTYMRIIENNTHNTISDNIQLLSLLGVFKINN